MKIWFGVAVNNLSLAIPSLLNTNRFHQEKSKSRIKTERKIWLDVLSDNEMFSSKIIELQDCLLESERIKKDFPEQVRHIRSEKFFSHLYDNVIYVGPNSTLITPIIHADALLFNVFIVRAEDKLKYDCNDYLSRVHHVSLVEKEAISMMHELNMQKELEDEKLSSITSKDVIYSILTNKLKLIISQTNKRIDTADTLGV